MTSFRVLGPVEAWTDERQLVLGGRQQVALLAFLLLSANQAVSTDAVIDALWGPEREGARHRLQMGVSRLRRALKPLDLGRVPCLRTVSGGYLLVVGVDQLDAGVFARWVREGREALEQGDPRRASSLLVQALALWRGPPLAEVAFEEFAQSEIRRLEELRLVALETRIDADLQVGRHAELVGELEGLLAGHPTRERIAEQLMTALYRCGRQADALGVYQRTRAHLADELGLEPGPVLKKIQAQVLNQDQALSHLGTSVDSGLANWEGDRSGALTRDASVAGSLNGCTVPTPSNPLVGRSEEVACAPKPAGRAPARPPGNLPVPPTPFVGRERELAEVAALLRAEARLLTLTGVGGSGKTRLALSVAERAGADYRDGVWFVGFGEISDAEVIVPTICQVLDLAEQADVASMTGLKDWLARRRLLLVLDNLEQLREGTIVVGELLAACPEVTMLVTSREPLHLAGECQYEVPVLMEADAVELFTSRAQAVAPGRVLDREVAGAICERLDWLPLGIELAAARTKALSPPEILTRLNSRLRLLTGGPRDAPKRQRTLKATIDWSYELLNADERRLFARLAVFAGGCTFDAAQAVCHANVDTVQALVDRSLLRTDGERYSMLETLREYGLDRLEEAGEAEELRRRHHRWFAELLDAEALDPRDLYSGNSWQKMHSSRVGTERENIKSALTWALQQRLGRGWTRG